MKKKKCTVENCENNVAEGNYFLCNFHFKHGENEKESSIPYSERVYKKVASQ